MTVCVCVRERAGRTGRGPEINQGNQFRGCPLKPNWPRGLFYDITRPGAFGIMINVATHSRVRGCTNLRLHWKCNVG